ncbi:MAG: tyrosine-type recombinase/integrase [Polyangia bacterium]
MRTEKAIVLGPYVEHHGEKERFRLILKSSGRRKSLFYPTLAEARRAKAQLEKEAFKLDEKSVEELITEYVKYLGEHEGYRARTQANEQQRLRNFFGSTASEMRLSTIHERKAEQMYLSHAQRLGHVTGRALSPTTHRGDLRILKRFGAWAQKAGYVGTSPFGSVEPIGRDRTGKPQLRMDELDRWLQVAWADVQRGHGTALAAMLCLWRGLRVSEVLDRVVRDLDEEGSVLVIERAKTRAGNRRVDIPEFLRPYVKQRTDGQAPGAWLFRQEREPNKALHQQSVHKRVRWICRHAKVPLICTHSLRGMNATLKLQAGASEDYVARSIGHTSFGITLRHYVDPGVKATLDSQRVDAALARVTGPSRSPSPKPPSSVQTLLRSLSEAERAALLEALLVEHPVQ